MSVQRLFQNCKYFQKYLSEFSIAGNFENIDNSEKHYSHFLS